MRVVRSCFLFYCTACFRYVRCVHCSTKSLRTHASWPTCARCSLLEAHAHANSARCVCVSGSVLCYASSAQQQRICGNAVLTQRIATSALFFLYTFHSQLVRLNCHRRLENIRVVWEFESYSFTCSHTTYHLPVVGFRVGDAMRDVLCCAHVRHENWSKILSQSPMR